MSWQDRLREAAYTGAESGTRLTFGFENVSRARSKKTASFTFPDADGTYIQDTGVSGRRYPVRAWFWGDDHDEQADAFDELLGERGAGILDHPRYGRVTVVPFGDINQRDDLKTAANQTVIELTFWETIDLVYPSAQSDPASDVLSAVDEYNEAAATELDEGLDLDTSIERVTFQNDYEALLATARSGLQTVADAQADVQKQFNAINTSINQGIDVLVSQPLTLAFQTTQLLQAPARALTSIQARLDAYGNLADSIINRGSAAAGNDSRQSNSFKANDLYASTAVTGSIVSVVNNQFATKSDALQAAEVILSQFEGVQIWREENYADLDEIDTGETYRQLQEAVALTAGFLVEISFSLLQERRIVLDRNRTIVDLAAELYGTVDEKLDFLITSNDLTGSEIIELPKGREIAYYT